MKRSTATGVRLGLMFVLGAWLLAPEAQAVSMKSISLGGAIANGGAIVFFLGEDGAIWYTMTATKDSAVINPVNRTNPFFIISVGGTPCIGLLTSGCNGFARSSSLATQCALTGDTCAEIYARIPGPGSFIAAPTVQDKGPICANSLNIIATGGDNRFYYTLYDSHSIGNLFTMDPTCPGGDPFSGAAEDKNLLTLAMNDNGTGFVSQASLALQCTGLGRTCVGVWVQFPK